MEGETCKSGLAHSVMVLIAARNNFAPLLKHVIANVLKSKAYFKEV